MADDRTGTILGVAGVVLGILGILIGAFLSWYFYEKSRSFREPIFALDPYPSAIYSLDKARDAPIKVLAADGSPLKSNVYLARHTLWNRGNQAVMATDVLEPLKLSLETQGGTVLSARAVRMSRGVVNCKAVPAPGQPNTTIVTFAVLDELDGCTVNVYFTADSAPRFSVQGTVVGVTSIGASSDADTSPYRTSRLYTVSQYVAMTLVTIGMVLQFWVRRFEFPLRMKLNYWAVMPIMVLGMVAMLIPIVAQKMDIARTEPVLKFDSWIEAK
jgi:hypothetical protein